MDGSGSLPAADYPGPVPSDASIIRSYASPHGGRRKPSARTLVEHLQGRGQWGARDFDKVIFELPIPKCDPKNRLHRQLAEAAASAEQVATAVKLPDGEHFVRSRQRIRAALTEDGIAHRMDALVEKLLAG